MLVRNIVLSVLKAPRHFAFLKIVCHLITFIECERKRCRVLGKVTEAAVTLQVRQVEVISESKERIKSRLQKAAEQRVHAHSD